MEMDTGTSFHILDKPFWISYSANNPGKNMHPIILPPAMDK